MKKRVAGLVLGLGLIAAGAASAADYYIVSRSKAVFVAVELGTVKKTGSVASARVTMARAEPIQIGDKSIAYFVSLEEFDCEKHVTRTVAPSLFLADGSLVASFDDPSEWKPIIPDSQADLMLETICHPASQEAALVEDWTAPKNMVANYRQRIAAGSLN